MGIVKHFALCCFWGSMLRVYDPWLKALVKKAPRFEILSPLVPMFLYYQTDYYLSLLPSLIGGGFVGGVVGFVRNVLSGFSSYHTFTFYFSVSTVLFGYPAFRYLRTLISLLAPSNATMALVQTTVDNINNSLALWIQNVTNNKTCDIRVWIQNMCFSLTNRSSVPDLLTSKEIEDNWPHTVSKNDDHANQMCGICGIELGVKVWIREMGCGCSFHMSCIDKHLKHVDGMKCGVCSKKFK